MSLNLLGWALSALGGCAVDYGVTGQTDTPDALGDDTATTADTASTSETEADSAEVADDLPVEETDTPADTDPPEDTGDAPEEPEEPEDPTPAVGCEPGPDGSPVGCAMEVGPGRLFVWGDEHATFEEYRPSSERFWEGALGWLSDGGRLTVQDVTGSAVIPDVASDLGLTTTSSGGDIVIVDLWRGVSGADIAAWLDDGKAVMVMAVGFGASECTYLSAVTAGLPLTYDCAAEPWGPVGAFTSHPIASGLASADAPFLNGRAVVADDPTAAEAVAFIP